MAGQKRRPNSPHGDELRRKAPKDESAASLRRGGKSVISAEADESVATLPRTALEVSKSAIGKEESAASLRRGGKSVLPFKDDNVANLPRTASGGSKPTRDEDKSAAPPRMGGKFVIPAMRDVLANLPTSALGGSKSSDELDGGGLKPSVERAASCLDPPMSAIHAHLGLVVMRRSLGIAFLRKADFSRDMRRTTIRIRSRSNARTHSHSRRLVSQKASARVPIPLFPLNHLVFGRYNRTTQLHMHCLGSPTGN
jgi:hypothetical protein